MIRRLLVTTLAVPALLLSGCGSDEPEVLEPSPSATADAAATTGPPDDVETTTEDAETTTTEDAETTTTEDDAAGTSEGPAAGDAEGGEEGQAAADRAKEWLVAFVNGEEEVCDYMLDLSSEGPMTDSQTDYDFCTSYIPPLAQDMFGSEVAGIMESIEITGADVQGDTAVVDRDNFSELFAEGFGEDVITLKKVDGEWYVDLNASFQNQ